jgi:hypothetical protein
MEQRLNQQQKHDETMKKVALNYQMAPETI